MNFAEKLRALRKGAKMSQEQLAEKIGVSRQAITKWETDGGLPDIANIMAIAALFGISMDELLSTEKIFRTAPDFSYESVTEYDVAALTDFDVHTPGASEVRLTTYPGEKVRVRLLSNLLPELQKQYKVQIDERRNRMDVDIRRLGGSEAAGKDGLTIELLLPAEYTDRAEVAITTGTLRLMNLAYPVELSGKAAQVHLEGVTGEVSLDVTTDMEIHADALPQVLAINQINATSTLFIPKGAAFYTKVKGRSNHISYQMGGQPCEPFADEAAESRVELAGMNAELTIEG